MSLLWSLRSGIDYKQDAPLALECTERQRQASDRRKDSRIANSPAPKVFGAAQTYVLFLLVPWGRQNRWNAPRSRHRLLYWFWVTLWEDVA